MTTNMLMISYFVLEETVFASLMWTQAQSSWSTNTRYEINNHRYCFVMVKLALDNNMTWDYNMIFYGTITQSKTLIISLKLSIDGNLDKFILWKRLTNRRNSVKTIDGKLINSCKTLLVDIKVRYYY